MNEFKPPIAPPDTPEARAYNRARRRLDMGDFLLNLIGLLLLLVTGWTRGLRDLTYTLAGQNFVLAIFFYVLALSVLGKLLGLSLDYAGYRLEHRYHLSNQKFGSWAWDELKGWAVGLVLATIVVELLYFIMRQSPQYWWLEAWAAFVILFVLLAQVAPIVLFPIFYKFRPLEREELKQRLLRLSERAGTRVRGVYEWKLSEKSNKANAALAGLGKTRRIIIADTLLANYSDDEIEAVLAHELGHQVHRHIPKGIAVQAVITFIGFWGAARVLHYAVRTGMFPRVSDFANLPLLALVSVVLSLVLLPLLNAWLRHNERQADQYALRSIPSPAPFISSMSKLADQNLAERSPARWVEVIFHSHPPIGKRIAAAQNFVERESAAFTASGQATNESRPISPED